MSRYVLEVGTEPIPAGYLPPALSLLAEHARRDLTGLRLHFDRVRALGTARRLVLEVEGLAECQEDLRREVRGPRVDIAFHDDGTPTPAAVGFARKNGVRVEDLERIQDNKGEFVLARVQGAGKAARDVLPEFAVKLVSGLAWPKTMTWNGKGFRFPRPVRWVVSLLDEDVLPLDLAGKAAGRDTWGHRVLGPGTHAVSAADRFAEGLRSAGVILDPDERRGLILEGLERESAAFQGRYVPDPGLLDEVVFLAEHPHIFSGSFDSRYLELPREVVVTAMRSHQRYFAVEDAKGHLLPRFLVVCDGRWEDPALVVSGNERVLRARLEDAGFYWRADLKKGLDRLADSLRNVVWLESLGTLWDKAQRVKSLVDFLGRKWFPQEWDEHRDDALRAAHLAKADLAGEMIKDGKEFTGLQGIMGSRYAEAQGEKAEVARALVEQYLPRGAADALPESVEGTVLAVADRVDTIAGCWAAGFVPSGSQDPYALRRAAGGVVRICMEKKLPVSLGELVQRAVQGLPENTRRPGLEREILDFLRDRTAFFLRERGIGYDVVDAVLAAGADDPVDEMARAEALQRIRGRKELQRLVVGFKRAANILKGVDEGSLPVADSIAWAQAHPTERRLWETTQRTDKQVAKLRRTKEYGAMLHLLLEMREPIDAFFEDVMVMSDDPGERTRRLALLAEVRSLFRPLFDPGRIVLEGETSSPA